MVNIFKILLVCVLDQSITHYFFMAEFLFVVEWKYTVCKKVTQTSINKPTRMHTLTH